MVEHVPKAKRYTDYREMLSQQKDIDAVIVATPDHMHAAIASAAMDLGKHVYVQKPLCWSVEEARHLAKKAKDNPKIATQMGNQGHSGAESRTTVEYIQQGAIGDVTRGPRLDQSSARLLAAGTAAPEAARGPDGRRQRAAARRGDGRDVEAPHRGGAGRRCHAARTRICSGISSSASRRRSSTTRSITRSTGAAGWTGARARSATWART